MLQLEDALGRILHRIEPLSSELVAPAVAEGRICRDRLLAAMDLPPFDNSAMDGYAVRAADLRSASPSRPVTLRVVGRTPAGERHGAPLDPGTCVRVFTGSGLPEGTDAVVMQEETAEDPERVGHVRFLTDAAPWENIRFCGEDVKRGTVIAQTGDALNTGHVTLLAAAGMSHVAVGRRPTVGLLATGSELREAGESRGPGHIYESNRVTLSVLIVKAGGMPRIYSLIQDDLRSTELAVAKALDECDVVVTTGGVSVGELDFVKAAFTNLGGEMDFWKVAIKPGKPLLFGRYKGKLLFGLPGNPVSAWVTFLLFVRPALFRLQGATQLKPASRYGKLGEALKNPGERRQFARVILDDSGTVRSAGSQASHILSTMVLANGLVEINPNEVLPAGTEVRVLALE